LGLQDNKNTNHLLCYRGYLGVLHQIHQEESVEVPLVLTHQDCGMGGRQETWSVLIINKKSLAISFSYINYYSDKVSRFLEQLWCDAIRYGIRLKTSEPRKIAALIIS
jgi:hypothetical protein